MRGVIDILGIVMENIYPRRSFKKSQKQMFISKWFSTALIHSTNIYGASIAYLTGTFSKNWAYCNEEDKVCPLNTTMVNI